MSHRRASATAALVAAVVVGAAAAIGPAHGRDVPGFGSVAFANSCAPGVQADLDAAIARLHSFDAVSNAFQTIARADPTCAIAWWGAAMSVRGNPLVGELEPGALKAGRVFLARAKAARAKTERERALVAALDVYFRDYASGGHAARTRAYEAAMERAFRASPDDVEVGAFYGLSILEAVDLTDRTYARQLKAGAVLEPLWARYPRQPGAPHYLIHAYDYAPLAARGLEAARRYPGIATASVHAQHMPAHVFSMLGPWAESVAANEASAALMAATTHQHGPAVDALDPHGMDFIVYARLQMAQDKAVDADLRAAEPSPERTLARARFVLERGDWKAAASLPVQGVSALDAVTLRFVRAVGAGRAGSGATARTEDEALRSLKGPVKRSDGAYWSGLIDVYAPAAEAWIALKEGRSDEARLLMLKAAELDDGREKHILLENKLVPMRELYGELLLELGRLEEALAAFVASLETAPNRFRSFAGAARAAAGLRRTDEAKTWSAKLIALTQAADTDRPEIAAARARTKE